jgi:hypothetical protein
MTPDELTLWQNQVFTKLVIDTLKQQRAEGKTEFLLDKYEIDRLTQEKLKRLIAESGGQ